MNTESVSTKRTGARPPTLVVGASGLLGGEIVRLLSEAGHNVRALVRGSTDVNKRLFLESLQGVTLVSGDLKNPVTLASACSGVDHVVSTASATLSRQAGDSLESVDLHGNLALVEAAQGARVGRMVFVSFAPHEVDSELQRAKRRVEQALVHSGMAYTILRPTYFTEVWLSPMLGFDPLHGRVRVFGDGTGRVHWVSFRDVARFAVAACERESFSKKTIELGGPDALSQLEVLRIFNELGAPAVTPEYVPVAQLEDQLRRAREAGSSLDETFAALMLGVARGQTIDTTGALELLSGRLKTVREFATQTSNPKQEN